MNKAVLYRNTSLPHTFRRTRFLTKNNLIYESIFIFYIYESDFIFDM